MSGATMWALAVDELGGPETAALRELPIPEPGEGEVRLRVEAVGLGFVDGLIAAGGYQVKPPPPYVPGAEIVGIVDALGPAVGGMAVGSRVASWQLLRGGGAAEYAIAPAHGLTPVPDGLAPATAAAMILDYLTAHHALFDRGGLRAGETALILGAAGGVGGAAVQLAARAGARVIAAASTAAKRESARAFGADILIDYGAADWRAELRRHFPDGVDVVVDPIGGSISEAAFRSLASGGRHLILGFASGQIAALPTNLPLVKNAALLGVDARRLFETAPDHARAIWADLFDRAARGLLLPPDITLHGLADAERAFAALMSRSRSGKPVLVLDR